MANEDKDIVIGKIKALRRLQKTGVQIAEVLHRDAWSLDLVQAAFRDQGYVVEAVGLEVKTLHVSNQPVIGTQALAASARPRELPKFIWI